MVTPFLRRIAGHARPADPGRPLLPAVTGRNIPSVNGRTDYVRVSLTREAGRLTAWPVFGKSGLFNSMTAAAGLIRINADTEGLDRGTPVEVILF
ncbi:MAG: molybdopterin molybdenumtransferase MoeA, partial [Desulfosudaceae bacterium]